MNPSDFSKPIGFPPSKWLACCRAQELRVEPSTPPPPGQRESLGSPPILSPACGQTHKSELSRVSSRPQCQPSSSLPNRLGAQPAPPSNQLPSRRPSTRMGAGPEGPPGCPMMARICLSPRARDFATRQTSARLRCRLTKAALAASRTLRFDFWIPSTPLEW
jgi:hypothetical protein